MPNATIWEVRLYAPGETRPASSEAFARFDTALHYALTLKRDRPSGWKVQVHPPSYAEPEEIDALKENALFPA